MSPIHAKSNIQPPTLLSPTFAPCPLRECLLFHRCENQSRTRLPFHKLPQPTLFSKTKAEGKKPQVSRSIQNAITAADKLCIPCVLVYMLQLFFQLQAVKFVHKTLYKRAVFHMQQWLLRGSTTYKMMQLYTSKYGCHSVCVMVALNSLEKLQKHENRKQ